MMEIKRLLSSLNLPTPILITLFKVKTWQKKSSGGIEMGKITDDGEEGWSFHTYARM